MADEAASIRIQMATHLWMHWLDVAAERHRAAAAARAAAVKMTARDARFADALGREMRAALVAITSASHAIDALYGEVRPMIPVPSNLLQTWEDHRTARPVRIVETLKCGCALGARTNEWPKQFADLYRLRDPVVHHGLKTRPAVPHPIGGTNVAQEMAVFVVENVQPSVDLAFDVVLTALERPRAPDLVEWATRMSNVPEQVRAMR